MPEWQLRLKALYTHDVLIARPRVDFSYLCAEGYAERTLFRDGDDGLMMAYQITEAGQMVARRINLGTYNER